MEYHTAALQPPETHCEQAALVVVPQPLQTDVSSRSHDMLVFAVRSVPPSQAPCTATASTHEARSPSRIDVMLKVALSKEEFKKQNGRNNRRMNCLQCHTGHKIASIHATRKNKSGKLMIEPFTFLRTPELHLLAREAPSC